MKEMEEYLDLRALQARQVLLLLLLLLLLPPPPPPLFTPVLIKPAIQARQALLQNKSAPHHLLRAPAPQPEALAGKLAGGGSKDAADIGASLMGVKLIHGEGNVFKSAGVIIKPNLNSYMEFSKVITCHFVC